MPVGTMFSAVNGMTPKASRLWVWALVSLLGTPLSGCLVTTSTKQGASANTSNLQVCEVPRPRVCTMEYRPVCATLVSNASKTYASGCNACADIAVVGYIDDPCETSTP